MPREKTIFLFRHGEVEEKLQKRFRGVLDCELSPEGIRMSEANARFIVDAKVDWVVTSGRKRADLVGHLAAREGILHHVDSRFCEANFGKWEGKNWEEVQTEYPEHFKTYQEDFSKLSFPEGESIAQMEERVRAAFHEWLKKDFSKMAIVGHSTANTALLASLKGIAFRDQTFQVIGSMHEIKIAGKKIVIVRENAIFYLP